MKEKPETMTIAEYNALLMEDAFRALSEAKVDILMAQSYAESAARATEKVVGTLRTVYTQMRLEL